MNFPGHDDSRAGAFVNSRLTRAAAILGAAVILVLNLVLVSQAFGVPIPGRAE